MSVESEILRIQHNIADAYAAVSDKGGEVPLQPTSANLAPAIASIQASSGSTDGTPIGTVISFMGLSAPDGYLVCDGAVYDISAYPKLANFINAQFGSFGYFGGDGTTTFAVPDMRNLFIRGYHGEAEEQLSGDIGQKQDATNLPWYISTQTSSNVALQPGAIISITNEDSSIENSSLGVYHNNGNKDLNHSPEMRQTITVRPVNMSVLFCIKAYSPGNNRGDEYSTEEIPVGTWIDGKTIYRKVFVTNAPSSISAAYAVVSQLKNIDSMVSLNGKVTMSFYGQINSVPDSHVDLALSTDKSSILSVIRANAYAGLPLLIVFEYTKTTD